MPRFATLAACFALAVVAFADPWDEERNALVVKLKDADPAKRAEAVRALKEHRTPKGVDFLVELFLAEKDPAVATALGDVIGGVLDGEGRPRFFQHCRAGRAVADRAKIVALLGRGGYRDTYDVLKALFKDPAPEIRTAALLASRDGRYQGIEPAAREALADKDPAVRAASAAALGAFRLFESAEALIAALEKEADAPAKDAIQAALASVSGQPAGGDAAAWKSWMELQKGLRVGQAAVDNALDRAGKYLVGWREAHPYVVADDTVALELYAMVHAGVPMDNKVLQSAIAMLYQAPMERTYRVAIGAMALFDISPSIHQPWLARAAAFLVYNQLDNGFWDYGDPIPGDTPSLAPPVLTGAKAEMGGGTKALKKVPVGKLPKKKNGTWWDLSNTQYALLGLRACVEAQIDVPKEVWTKATNALKAWQQPEGGFCYNWLNKTAYGSIHTSGLGAYIVARYYAGHGDKRDGVIDKGIDYLGAHFSASDNPLSADTHTWLFYYYYGMERVGVLANTEFFGKHEWYQEGARYLLSQQRADGSWGDWTLRDTPWAILFLRRATRPVVKVEDK